MTKAQLTVLAGPTAVGKGTVVAALTKRYPALKVSVSATTRDPRPGENLPDLRWTGALCAHSWRQKSAIEGG